MNRLLIRLWGVVEGEDAASINYQIAQTLIQNSASIRHTSMTALAELCNVSKPSISRFCKNLGYDDFYEFRSELGQIIPDWGSKYLLPGEQNDALWVVQYLNEVKENADRLQNGEIQARIKKLAEDILVYSRVYLMGNMQSGKTAESLHYNLHTVKKNIQAVTNLADRTQIFEKHLEHTLFVVFSVSGGYFRALFPAGQFSRQSSTSKVWLVTTNPSVKKIDGVDEILNLSTGDDLAGSNICLEMAANLIAFYYWRYCRS